MRAQIGEGIRQVAGSRPLRSIALAAAITNLFGRLMVVLVPLYLVREAGYRGSPPGRSVPSPPEDNIIVLLVAYSEPPFQNKVLCEFVVRPD